MCARESRHVNPGSCVLGHVEHLLGAGKGEALDAFMRVCAAASVCVGVGICLPAFFPFLDL